MHLANVSITALYTLVCRVAQSETDDPIIDDPLAARVLAQVLEHASPRRRRKLEHWRREASGKRSVDVPMVTRRAVTYDGIAQDFLAKHPTGTVVSLGAGFCTRFWRIAPDPSRYIEVDLPECVQAKAEILGDAITFEQIGCSVMDTRWMDQVTARTDGPFLIVAEGLFMYLPESDVADLLARLSTRFAGAQIAMDVIEKKYSRGLYRVFLRAMFWFRLGLDMRWVSGLTRPKDIEDYPGYRLESSQGLRSGVHLIQASISQA